VLISFFYASSAAASYFSLDGKVAKHQGVDLMSGKIVKALISATQVPMKNRKGCVALDSGGLKVFA